MINETKLTLTFCRILEKIKQKEKIAIGKFSSKTNKELLKMFIDEKVLQISSQGRTDYIYCTDNKYLDNYLQTFGIDSLDKYKNFLKKKETSRAEAIKIASNSKQKKGRIFNGFFLKSYLPIVAKIENQEISLQPQKGTWIYIENYKTLEIRQDITIVGVENSETFTLIENYKHLFTDIKPLFLLRYNNNSYIEWLQKIENDYLHFGDFDLSAIAIYISEFRNKLTTKRCDFFIPENINELIKNSKNKSDYIKQLNDPKVKGINFDKYSKISNLANLILKEKRTLEQEIMMK